MKLKAHSDHNRYLSRMKTSLSESTKSLIPLYIADKQTILDVGCADGSTIIKLQEMNPHAEITGIDICQESVDLCKNKGLKVSNCDINELIHHSNDKYDAIIFSSVLHEISSYAKEEKYNAKHIKTALKSARELLSENGIIIIRDGLGTNDNKPVRFRLKNNNDLKFVKEFVRLPIYQKSPFSIPKNTEINSEIELTRQNFKEFCFTYTWGEKSWERESQEKFGILTLDEWIATVISCGLNIKLLTTSSEKYIEKLKEKIICDEIEYVLSTCTITMILEKAEPANPQ